MFKLWILSRIRVEIVQARSHLSILLKFQSEPRSPSESISENLSKTLKKAETPNNENERKTLESPRKDQYF